MIGIIHIFNVSFKLTKMAPGYKTISFQSAELLKGLNQDNRLCFTVEQASAYLPHSSRDAVRKLLSDMTKRRLLMRIKDGLYYIIPYDRDPDSFMPHWHLLPQYIVGDAKYYIGYYCAMQIQSLTTQPIYIEQIVINKQIKPSIIEISGIKFKFIYHNPKHFFGYKRTWIDSFNKVECSDLEKTLVDGLFKPDYAGGITEIVMAIHKTRKKIDYQKLLAYVEQFGSIAVSKRLGFLLELLEIDTPIIYSLQKMATNSYFLLEPCCMKEGKMHSRWNIRQNLDNRSILSPIFT